MSCEREFLTRRAVRPWHSCPEKPWVAGTWAWVGFFDPFLSKSSHIKASTLLQFPEAKWHRQGTRALQACI
mgnify:CR=1 FL=1